MIHQCDVCYTIFELFDADDVEADYCPTCGKAFIRKEIML